MSISVFDSWAKYITNILEQESTLASALVKHRGELGSARESLINGVLSRILPSIYDVGTGEIVDHLGKHSKQIDIVIARRDFPVLSLPHGAKTYLLESVVATIEVKSGLDAQTLYEALENCASVGELALNIVDGRRQEIAKERGLKEAKPGRYIHENPVETARFDLLGRPTSYIFGFKGYKNSTKDLAHTIGTWIDKRVENNKDVNLMYCPAVVVAEGCYAWRNSAPYLSEQNYIFAIGKDETPLRLLILHLLYILSTKIMCLPDTDGIIPNLHIYLQQMKIPTKHEYTVGKIHNKV